MSDPADLPPELHAACDAYEAEWARGTPELRAFLKDRGWTPESEDQSLAHELAAIDLELRWRQDADRFSSPPGSRPTADDYAVYLFGNNQDARAVWVVAELRARRIAGQRDVADLLRTRYADRPEMLIAITDLDEAATESSAAPGATVRGLKVRCPHCHNPIELVPDAELESILCECCGSDFSLVSEPAATHAANSAIQVAHFRLVKRVGLGAFGSVWKAADTQLDRTVAIKVPRQGQFDEQQEKAFLREAQNAAQLSHPNIVPVYEVGRDGDTLYIVSEFVRGVTLADWLTGRMLTTREAVELCRKVAGALEHAHDRGVIHRDLKPGNIMLDAEGEPHLMDFGLAKREASEITMSIDGRLLGTPAYMSPEQAQGAANETDARSDIYSMGVILFQLLTGELPFRGNQRMLLHQVIHEEPPSPRRLNASVPKDLETITLACLEKAPSKRYQTAAELRNECDRFLERRPIERRPVSIATRMVRWCYRNPRAALSAAIVTASLLIGASAATFFAVAEARQAAIATAARDAAQLAAKRAEQQAEAARIAHNDADTASSLLYRNLSTIYDVRPTVTVAEVLGRAKSRVLEEPDQSLRRKVKSLHAIGLAQLSLRLNTAASDTLRQVAILSEPFDDIESRILYRHDAAIADLRAFRHETPVAEIDALLTNLAPRLGREDVTLALSISLAQALNRTDQNAFASKVIARVTEMVEAQSLQPADAEKLSRMTSASVAIPLDLQRPLRNLLEAEPYAQPSTDSDKDKWALSSLHNLATATWLQGDQTAAIRMFKDVVAGRTQVLGSDHKDTLLSKFDLAEKYDLARDYQEALRLYKEIDGPWRSIHQDQPTRGLLAARRIARVHYFVGNVGESIAAADEFFTESVKRSPSTEAMALAEKLDQVKEWDPPRPEVALGLALDGADDFVVVPGLYFDGQPPFTWEAFVEIHDFGRFSWLSIVSSARHGSAALELVGGHPQVKVGNSGRYFYAKASKRLSLRQRSHLAAVWNGQSLIIYVNGKRAAEFEKIKECSWIDPRPMFVGAAPLGFFELADGHMRGVLEQVRVSHDVEYDKDFVPSETLSRTQGTLALFDFRRATGEFVEDLSGHGNHGVIMGGEWMLDHR